MESIAINPWLYKLLSVSLLLLFLVGSKSIMLRWLNPKMAYQMWLLVPLCLVIPQGTFFPAAANTQVFTFFSSQLGLASGFSIDEVYVSQGLSLWLVLWGIGVLFALGRYIHSYNTLIQSFRPLSFSLDEEHVQSIAAFNRGRRFKINVRESRLASGPAVVGFLNRYLILPNTFNELGSAQQAFILSHELCHFQRRDHQINFMVATIKCLLWFHPLVYWSAKHFEAVQEISCDYQVSQTLDNKARCEYAQALMDAVFVHQTRHLLSQWKYPSLIKERIQMLSKSKPAAWHTYVGFTVALSALLVTNTIAIAESVENKDISPVTTVAPKYPKEAVKNGQSGHIKFKFDVNKAGEPINIMIVESTPKGVFDDEALQAFKAWTFDGRKAPQNQYYVMEFKLN